MSKPIHIIVCVKQVIDPEAPAASFKINSENQKISAEGVPPVLSPYDESALELALRMRDTRLDIRISAVSFGPKLARPVLMKALAVGADELYMIEGQAANDARVTAAILASVISGKSFNIILTGRQAADTNSGSVGLALAARLNIPSVSWARKIDVEGDGLIVERVIPDGCETLRGPMPALVTVSHEAGSLRLPKLQDIKKAKEKPIHNIRLDDLKLDPFPNPLTTLMRLEAPSRQRHCRLIEADTPADAATELAQTLVRDGIL